jgi:hypothetical protein
MYNQTISNKKIFKKGVIIPTIKIIICEYNIFINYSQQQLIQLLALKMKEDLWNGNIIYQTQQGINVYNFYSKIIKTLPFTANRFFAVVCKPSPIQYIIFVSQTYFESVIPQLHGIRWNLKSNERLTFVTGFYPFSKPLITYADEVTLFVSGDNSKTIYVVDVKSGNIVREIVVQFHINWLTKSVHGVLASGETYFPTYTIVVVLLDRYGNKIHGYKSNKHQRNNQKLTWRWCLELNRNTWIFTDISPDLPVIFNTKYDTILPCDRSSNRILDFEKISDTTFAILNEEAGVFVFNDVGACLHDLCKRGQNIYMEWIPSLGLLLTTGDGIAELWNIESERQIGSVRLPKFEKYMKFFF